MTHRSAEALTSKTCGGNASSKTQNKHTLRPDALAGSFLRQFGGTAGGERFEISKNASVSFKEQKAEDVST